MGSSLGGLVSLYFAHAYPDDYDFAASLSGTVGWGSIGMHNPTIIELMAADGHGPVPLYVDSGGGGTCEDADGDGIEDDAADGADNYCENIQLRDSLVDAGYQYEVDLWHWWEPDAEHNEMAWAARVFRPLQIFADQ
jgi:predicted alpha/beta superfamily hydrolase